LKTYHPLSLSCRNSSVHDSRTTDQSRLIHPTRAVAVYAIEAQTEPCMAARELKRR
jgi:hypothetical protein